jgi:hypothetical protein
MRGVVRGAILLFAFRFGGSVPDAKAAAGWRQDVYVWQRAPGEELRGALDASRDLVDGFCPLAAELKWATDGRAEVFSTPLDHEALKATGRAVGLVIRIGPFAGPFARDDERARMIATLAREVLDSARQAGLKPAELQIDFDCAERTLDGYREWLLALREAAGGTRLVFTALPAWLRHRERFAALAEAADGYVLQVHSLEKPANGPDAPYSLCDYEKTLAWARLAAGTAPGRPFRVALPTYGYRLVFNAAGEFVALSAEGPEPRTGVGARTRVVRSDPAEMLRMERALATEPPPGCEGVIWFRLPVAGDRLNWDMTTFRKVLRGEEPRARLNIEARWSERGLAEIVVENRGDTSEPPPGRVRVAWPTGGRLVASDGLGGYVPVLRRGESGLELKNDADVRDELIGPGKRRAIGWLRFSDETKLELTRGD